jgi:hypothetical protein
MTEQSEWLTSNEATAYPKMKLRPLLPWVRQGKLQALMSSPAPSSAYGDSVLRIWTLPR